MAEGRETLKTPEQQLLLRWTDAYRALLDKLLEGQRPHEIKDCLLEVYKDTDCYLGEIIDKGHETPWSRDWPKEPGFYWFYGRAWPGAPLSMELAEVFLSANGHSVYICRGAFINKLEGADGFWTKATLPDPPEKRENHE